MSLSKMVTLRDGSEMPEILFRTAVTNMEGLANENRFVYLELIEKCKNQNYIPVHRLALKKWGMIDNDNNVDGIVERIILNAIDGEKLVNPLMKKGHVSRL